MKWQKKLNKKDRQHLRQTQNGSPTIAALKRNIMGQRRDGIRCWDCERIAGKLGVQVAAEASE